MGSRALTVTGRTGPWDPGRLAERPNLPPPPPVSPSPAAPRDKAGGYGIQALGSVLVEQVRGDILNVVGFPLNHFCRKMAELHGPPRPEHRPPAQRDSAPSTDTSESLSDVAPGGAGSHPARSDEGHGGAQAGGHPGSRDADREGSADSLPPFPTGLLELIDGFKASKVPAPVSWVAETVATDRT